MQEGESELGGLKISHGNTTPSPSTTDSQPVDSVAPSTPPAPSAAPSGFSSFQSNTQPTVQPELQQNTQPTPAPSQPTPNARPQSVPRLTNRFSDHVAPNPSQAPVTNGAIPATQATTPMPQPGNYPTDIVLSPASPSRPKSPKKIITIILVVLVLTAVGFGAYMLISNIIAGPVQQATEDLYNEIRPIYVDVDRTYSIMNDGYNAHLSFYELFISDYLYKNERSLYDALAPSTNYATHRDSELLEYIPTDVSSLSDIINTMSQTRYSSEINQKVKAIQAALPSYSAIMTTFADQVTQLKIAFLDNDTDTINSIISDGDTRFYIGLNQIDYSNVLSSWYNCTFDMPASSCQYVATSSSATNLVKDTGTVYKIFGSILDQSSIDTVRNTNSDIDQLLSLIKKGFYEE